MANMDVYTHVFDNYTVLCSNQRWGELTIAIIIKDSVLLAFY